MTNLLRYTIALILLSGFLTGIQAQEIGEKKSYSADFYPKLVMQDQPIAYWRMNLDAQKFIKNSVALCKFLKKISKNKRDLATGER